MSKGKGKSKGKTKSKAKTAAEGEGALAALAPAARTFDGYCLFCQSYGHRQQDCSHWHEAAAAIRQKLGTTQTPNVCFRCGRSRHYAAQCEFALAVEQAPLECYEATQEEDEERAAYLDGLAEWDTAFIQEI